MSADDASTSTEDEPTEVAFKTTSHPKWTWKAEVAGPQFRNAIEAAGGVVGAATLTISQDGFTLEGVDAANVCYARITHEPQDDEPLVTPGQFSGDVGVRTRFDASELTDLDVHDRYSVEIVHKPSQGDEGMTLTIENVTEWVDECETLATVSTQDPDGFGANDFDEAPGDDLDFQVDTTIPGYKLKGVLGAVAETADRQVILTPHEDTITVDGKALNHSICAEWALSVDGITSGDPAHYSPDYVADVAAAIQATESTRVRFGQELPLRIDQEHLVLALAPRVDFNDDDSGGDSA